MLNGWMNGELLDNDSQDLQRLKIGKWNLREKILRVMCGWKQGRSVRDEGNEDGIANTTGDGSGNK